MASKRQLDLLNHIVDMYVRKGEPISSGSLLENNNSLELSSATIRNEMVFLEKEGYIIKSDSSSSRTSGRKPTNKGYEYYLKHIKTNPNSILAIKSKLDKILNSRKDNIDHILKSAMHLINDSTNTLTLTKEGLKNDLLRDINCYPSSNEKALIIIVTNNGKVVNKELDLEGIRYSDFEKATKTFAKRLIGTSLNDLESNINSLNEILSIQMNGMEEKFQELIKLMFSKLMKENTKYSGMNSLISANDLDINTQIKVIFEMIENNSIWDLLEGDSSIETTMPGITVDMDLIDGVSVVKKSISIGERNKELTILGSKNQDYEKLFTMLDYLEKWLKEDKNEWRK